MTEVLALEGVGKVTIMACPTCKAALYEVADNESSRFYCAEGHSFSLDEICPEIEESIVERESMIPSFSALAGRRKRLMVAARLDEPAQAKPRHLRPHTDVARRHHLSSFFALCLSAFLANQPAVFDEQDAVRKWH